MKLNRRNDSWAKDDKHDFSVWREFTLKEDLKKKKKKVLFLFGCQENQIALQWRSEVTTQD